MPMLSGRSGNGQRIPFSHGGGRLCSLIAINDNEDLVGANGWIPTQRTVGDNEAEHSVAYPAAQQISYVYGFPLNAVVGTNDAQAIVITVAVAVVRRAIVQVIAAVIERARLDEAAFFEIEFAFLVPPVSCEDAKRLIGTNGGIAAHGLVGDGDSSIHAAAADKVFENVSDIGALILEAVIGSNNLPSLILGPRSRSENSYTNSEKSHCNNEQHISICDFHRGFLRCGDLSPCLNQCNPAAAARKRLIRAGLSKLSTRQRASVSACAILR